jgi:photoactive yellow protein
MTDANGAAGASAGPAGIAVVSDTALPTFADVTLAELDGAGSAMLDALPFGVVGLDASSRTQVYNQFECRLAGLSRESVLDQDFFLTTGVCMNNFLVAQRFEDEPELDVTIDYVLTFRMRPTPAKLRLLKHPTVRLRYILVQR